MTIFQALYAGLIRRVAGAGLAIAAVHTLDTHARVRVTDRRHAPTRRVIDALHACMTGGIADLAAAAICRLNAFHAHARVGIADRRAPGAIAIDVALNARMTGLVTDLPCVAIDFEQALDADALRSVTDWCIARAVSTVDTPHARVGLRVADQTSATVAIGSALHAGPGTGVTHRTRWLEDIAWARTSAARLGHVAGSGRQAARGSIDVVAVTVVG